MEMKALHGCGRIGFLDNVSDANGTRIARDFLQSVIKKLCVQAVAYHAKEKDNFLRFHERLMYSQTAAALNCLTRRHLSEVSLTRHQSGDSTTGRVDFWASYREAELLLELKQCYFSVNAGAHTKRVSEKVSSVVNQTRSLKKTAKGWGSKAALIGVCVILPYCQRNSEERLDKLIEESGKDPLSLGMEFVNAIYPGDVNFVGLWLPPEKMRKFDESDSGQIKWEYNPFIGFVAKIVPLQDS